MIDSVLEPQEAGASNAFRFGKNIQNCGSAVTFIDYRMSSYGVNLNIKDQDKKRHVFYAYNNQVKNDGYEDLSNSLRYRSWLLRTYPQKTSCSQILN